jgi:hypothetical protein
MKRNIAVVTSVGVALGLLGGCGGGDNGPPVASGSSGSSGSSAPGSLTQTPLLLDTQGVLVQAQSPMDTSSPYTVDAGLLVLTDTSETSSPISINANGT